MNKINNEYYFILENSDENFTRPSPDQNTANRRWNYERQTPGSPPFGFHNGAREFQKERGIKVRKPAKIMAEGSNILVPQTVRDALLRLDIPGLFTHPSYYIHDDGEWYEDYWYLAFGEQLDCWSRTESDYDEEPLEVGGFSLYQIYKLSLDQELLGRLPLKQRLLFQMGGSLDAHFTCHQSIAHLFRTDEKVNGVRLVKVSEY